MRNSSGYKSGCRTRTMLIARNKRNCGRIREILHADKGASPSPYNKMGVYAVYIISKAGGLIYSLDKQRAPSEVQLLCKYLPSFMLEEGDRGVMVKFGEEGGVKVGHTLLTVNNQPVTNSKLPIFSCTQ